MAPTEIKRLRRRLGFSQVELARRLGVSERTVSRWECGSVPIPKSTSELLKMWVKQLPQQTRRA